VLLRKQRWSRWLPPTELGSSVHQTNRHRGDC